MKEITDPRMAFRKIDATGIDGDSYDFKVMDVDDECVTKRTVECEMFDDDSSKSEAALEKLRDTIDGDVGEAYDADSYYDDGDTRYVIDTSRFGYEVVMDDEKYGWVAIFPDAAGIE